MFKVELCGVSDQFEASFCFVLGFFFLPVPTKSKLFHSFDAYRASARNEKIILKVMRIRLNLDVVQHQIATGQINIPKTPWSNSSFDGDTCLK